MYHNINGIFIDLGNTMRILVKDEQHQAHARRMLAELVGSHDSPESLIKCIDERYKTYRKWAFETWIEAPEDELWTRWLLPEYSSSHIRHHATELTFLFRQSMGRRVTQPDAKIVIDALKKRGYRLGIISNVITTKEIPDWLEAEGLTDFFQSVVLSSVFGRRKPDPEIYWEAARRIGLPPSECAYVGDNPARDVVGTRNAGFGIVILLMSREVYDNDPPHADEKPDSVIFEFKQLLELFPDKSRPDSGNISNDH